MLAEQFFMMFSNFWLLLPVFIALWKQIIPLTILSFSIALNSNLYHYSNNLDVITQIFGSNGTITLEPGVIIWNMNVTSRLVLMFLDYASSNLGFIFFVCILAPKSRKSGTYFFMIIGAMVYFLTIGLTRALDSPTPDPPSMMILVPVITSYCLIVYICNWYYYTRVEHKDFKQYYTDNFHTILLLLGFVCVIIGLICWVVIQNFLPSVYFWSHGVWHISVGTAQIFFILSIKSTQKVL